MSNLKMNNQQGNKKEILDTHEARSFYRTAMEHLKATGHRFLIGGAFAFCQHTGIYRDTKDLDIFCTASEYPDILNRLGEKGYVAEVRDSRWLAKAYKDDYFIDIIFNSPNGLCVVDQSWFDNSFKGEMEGVPTSFLGPEDLFWCKIYVQNKERFDGADVNHIILKQGKKMDWKKILDRLDHHWHLLFAQILNFMFVYPGNKDCVPEWLFYELLTRTKTDYELPLAVEKICRGPLLSHTQYNIDLKKWGFKNVC